MVCIIDRSALRSTVLQRLINQNMERIGVIGDVHAEHRHLRAAVEYLSHLGVDTIVCTGDLSDGTGDINTCIELLVKHDIQVVRGNHDRWVLENKARHIPNAHRLEDLSDDVVAYLQGLPTQLALDTSAGSLLLCHGVEDNDLQKIWPGSERMPPERSKRMDQLIADARYQFMINGHVHYRTLIHFEQLTLINAGTIRRDHHPGFSLLDFSAGQILGFEFEPQIHQVKVLPLSAQGQVFRNTQHFDGRWQPVTLYA